MSIETITQAKAEIEATSAFKLLTGFFDEDTFFEIDSFAKSENNFAEVVAGYGTVEGLPVYAFAQNSDIFGGAMSKAQAAKLKKIYDLAMKTGAPVVGFYDSIGGKLSQGNELMSAYGTMLNLSSNISGVVPQISVIIGTCLGTAALTAVNSDFVIMSKKATLSLDVTGKDADSDYNSAHGIASVIANDTDDAVQKAKELVTYLPSNNLNSAPCTFEAQPSSETCACFATNVADEASLLKLYENYGKNAAVALGRVDGAVVGFVGTKGREIDCEAASKIAKFVRFCDAFSIPVVTMVNSTGFTSIKSAAKVTSAYAEATTVKISVVTGTAIGAVYMAMAGTGAATDMTLALDNATISPINVEAAAMIMSPETMNVPLKQQAEAAKKFASESLSAINAAYNGYVEDVITADTLRTKLVSALDMLSSKRVSTLAKKHSTI